MSVSYDRDKGEVIIQAGTPLYNCSVDIYDEDETLWLHENIPVVSDRPVRINVGSLSAGQYILDIGTGDTYYTLPLNIEMD